MNAAKPYTHLSTSWRLFPQRHTLWSAADHLLQVRTNGCTETYQRFFYRDIHGIIIGDSSSAAIITSILAGVTIVFGLTFVVLLTDSEISWLSGGVTLTALVLLVINLMRGSTCVVFIKTGVQTERIRALTRRRNAQRILRDLEPRIIAAQAALVPPPLAPQSAAAAAPSTNVEAVGAVTTPVDPSTVATVPPIESQVAPAAPPAPMMPPIPDAPVLPPAPSVGETPNSPPQP